MMNTISSATSSTVPTTLTSSAESKPVAGTTTSSSTPSTAAMVTGSSTTTSISSKGTILSDLFSAADAFIQKEHLVPFAGYRYSNGSYGTMKDYEGAYIDVGKYNNYLFDKAAANLVAQAREKGIELDTKDVVAQLKDNNAEIAAMKLDDQKRRDLLGPANVLSRLGWSDLQAFTDMYITAKENGLDVSQVWTLASDKGTYMEPGITWIRNPPPPDLFSEPTRKLADEIRGRLGQVDFLGIGKELFLDFILDPESGSFGAVHGAGANVDVATRARLDFLSKLLDFKDNGLYYSSENHDNFLSRILLQNKDIPQSQE